MTTAIFAAGLVKTYPGGVRALEGLGLEVEAGTIFGLLGPNGAGKSTTVKVLTTLSRPDAGEARVAGLDVLREPDRVRAAIGVIAQRSGLDPEATARENLALQGRLHGLRRTEVRARAAELLDRLGLTEAADRRAGTFSGGMQRRLDIAMGLIHRPSVLFLDEPTTGLDPEIRAAMWAEITRLAREEGLTILLTTHYLEEADQIASRLAIVERGRIVAEGRPQELKAGLHGDAVTVDLSRPEANGRATLALERVAGVREVTLDGLALRARVDEGATAVPSVLSALESAGVAVASVTVSRPSLDDVYLQRVGRAFAAGDDREEEPRDHRTHPLGPDGRPLAAHPVAPALVRRHHARAAGHLAAALRRPLRAGRRHPGLRGRRLRRLPGAGHRRDDRPLLGRLERDGHHQRPRPRGDGPLPRLAGAAGLAGRRGPWGSSRPS